MNRDRPKMRALQQKTLRLANREIRSRLQRHALNHNLIRGPFASRLRWRSHNYFGVLNPVDYFPEHGVFLVELRLLLQRDEPLTVGAVDIVRTGRPQRAALIRYVAELRRPVRIGRVACPPSLLITALR